MSCTTTKSEEDLIANDVDKCCNNNTFESEEYEVNLDVCCSRQSSKGSLFDRMEETRSVQYNADSSEKMASVTNEYVKFDLKVVLNSPLNTKVMSCSDNFWKTSIHTYVTYLI